MSNTNAGQAPSDRAQEWFEEIVEPTVAEFLEQPDSKRKGCLAILAVVSMTEHYFHARLADLVPGENKRERKQRIGLFKDEVRDYKQGTGVFPVGLAADLANATKHAEAKNKISHEGMIPIPANACGVMKCGQPLGLGVEILVGEKQEWRLVEILECCMEFWREKLASPVQCQTGSDRI